MINKNRETRGSKVNATVDGLGWSDDGDRTLAVVRKGGHPDVVIIERVDWSVIERYLAERPVGPQGWLFATAGGQQMSRQTAYRLVREVADQVTGDRKKIGPHSLRHTFATLALTRACPSRKSRGRYVTCPRLRHSTTTGRYGIRGRGASRTVAGLWERPGA